MGQLGLMQVSLDPSKPLISPEDQAAKEKSIGDSLGSMLAGKFREWSDAKKDIEQEWLKDLRAYNAIYEAEILAAIGKRSKVFHPITRTKTQTAYARIIDLLFQSNAAHWEVYATTVPEIDPRKKSMLAKQIAIATGQIASDEELEFVVKDLADVTAKRMSREMEDQLVDIGYDQEMKSGILECCILGTGALKGVETKVVRSENWVQGPAGWELKSTEKQSPDIKHVSVFDLFPDPYATTPAELSGIFQTHILTRRQTEDLKNYPGFDTAKIDEILAENAKGNHTEEYHEIERRRIAGYNISTAASGRFMVLEYWGDVTGRELQACGCEVEDEGAIYQANVWTCGAYTLMARLNPNKPERIPYNIFPYKRVPHAFWGIGVPREMRSSQTTINTTVRVALDNLAISGGPMAEVNTSLLAPGESVTDLHPWRIIQRAGGDPSHPAVRYYQPGNVTAELIQMMEVFRRFADEETSLPSYTHGEQTASLNATASGMSQLMAAAQVVTKSTIKNIDDFLVRPLIKSLYDWNMKWSDNERIKGDMQIDARGSTALISKEVQSQRLIQFAGMTNNPTDAPLTKRVQLLREIAESLDIDAEKSVMTDDELEKSQQIGGAIDPQSGQPTGMGQPPGLSQQAA